MAYWKELAIPIKNIYKILEYVYKDIDYISINKKVSQSNDNINILEFYSSLLCFDIEKQIKKGLFQVYSSKTEALPLIRGSIVVSDTIKEHISHRKKIVCCFDELNVNERMNAIIKATLKQLNRDPTNEITDTDEKRKIKNLLRYFDYVVDINYNNINFTGFMYCRTNFFYKRIIKLCYKIYKFLKLKNKRYYYLSKDSYIPKKVESINIDDKFYKTTFDFIFERFVHNYYHDNINSIIHKIGYDKHKISGEVANEKDHVIQFYKKNKFEKNLNKEKQIYDLYQTIKCNRIDLYFDKIRKETITKNDYDRIKQKIRDDKSLSQNELCKIIEEKLDVKKSILYNPLNHKMILDTKINFMKNKKIINEIIIDTKFYNTNPFKIDHNEARLESRENFYQLQTYVRVKIQENLKNAKFDGVMNSEQFNEFIKNEYSKVKGVLLYAGAVSDFNPKIGNEISNDKSIMNVVKDYNGVSIGLCFLDLSVGSFDEISEQLEKIIIIICRKYANNINNLAQ